MDNEKTPPKIKAITLKEAMNISRERLNISKQYYYDMVRPKLKPKPLLVKRDENGNVIAKSLRVLASELDAVLEKIELDFKNRAEG